ncbi:hypothetical protein EZ428_04105 [Pedobacter frigiditerrae]|uniref:Uncharacterized protein n=1 Tax=Pedobacter frigiditerrae TaxID=2530452 RepID=A0A4R0N6S3_9SPHI|nr:hypothetical protein [Pedobacter frigiditerrae]TCC93964.1 hypothetical protein EZ428_04105 [Pedobacter frigiditerrae]
MARITGKFISGIVGPVIFKKVRNKQVVVSKHKGELIKMTAATFNAAYVFGYASTLSSYIRYGAEDLIAYYDGGMVSRLTGECNGILQKATVNAGETFSFDQDYFSRLNGFEFNTASPVKRYLFAQPEVITTAEDLLISLPEMLVPRDLIFAPNAKYCTVAFKVTLFDLKSKEYLNQEVQSFEVELQKDPITLPPQQLRFKGAPGALYLVSLGLFYAERTFAGKAVLNNQDLHPAAILRAGFCPGEPTDRGSRWQKMIFKDRKKRKTTGQNKDDARKGLFGGAK